MPNGVKKTCLLFVPEHSSEECKFLKEYTEKSSAQYPQKHNKACFGGNNKRTKTLDFEVATQEVNTMESDDETIPKKKKEKSIRKA